MFLYTIKTRRISLFPWVHPQGEAERISVQATKAAALSPSGLHVPRTPAKYSSRYAEQKRPMPSEIWQMSAADTFQGKLIVNAERRPVILRELG